MNIQENFSLKSYNTFGIDAKAKYFTEVQDIETLKEVINFSKQKHLEILFLGGGSNVLFTKDFEGLAIKLNLRGISENILNENEVLITAKAGENWHSFVLYCISKNYGGLENLSLIPGNVGTCPIQNIGAYGVEIKDYFYSCKVLNIQTLEIEELSLEQCKFGYRDSIFKNECKNQYVILEVCFKLTAKDHQTKTQYGAIKSELDKLGIENPSIQDISNAVINIRTSKLPNPKETGNAGSFFKNPTVPTQQYEELKSSFENIPGYAQGNLTKIPAAWLIENCGWKGKQIGNVACHEFQPLVIINKTGNATGKEVFDFSALIINSVKEKFGIELEREVNII